MKKIIALLLLVFLIIPVASCADNKEDAKDTTSPKVEVEETVNLSDELLEKCTENAKFAVSNLKCNSQPGSDADMIAKMRFESMVYSGSTGLKTPEGRLALANEFEAELGIDLSKGVKVLEIDDTIKKVTVADVSSPAFEMVLKLDVDGVEVYAKVTFIYKSAHSAAVYSVDFYI